MNTCSSCWRTCCSWRMRCAHRIQHPQNRRSVSPLLSTPTDACLYSQRVRGGILRYINLLTYLGLLTDSRSWVDFTPATTRNIGVAWGCSGCTCTPKEGKIFFRRNLQGKCASAPPRTRSAPQPEQESIYRTVFFWAG